jgi:hypothetical protein
MDCSVLPAARRGLYHSATSCFPQERFSIWRNPFQEFWRSRPHYLLTF